VDVRIDETGHYCHSACGNNFVSRILKFVWTALTSPYVTNSPVYNSKRCTLGRLCPGAIEQCSINDIENPYRHYTSPDWINLAVRLDVESRHLLERVECESLWLFCPEFADVFVRYQAFECYAGNVSQQTDMRLRRVILAVLAAGILVAVGGLAWAWRPAIAPTSAKQTISNWKTIDRGDELAAIGNCSNCHTKDVGMPYASGRALPTQFGTIYSSNLTPDLETGIGTWSEEAFRRAMHEGVDREGNSTLHFPMIISPRRQMKIFTPCMRS
jgi:hypothetical protein